MQVATHPIPSCRASRLGKNKASSPAVPAFAEAEINAYIAIRDDLLAEAEQTGSRVKMESVLVANDFIASCLKPARPPYQSQAVTEAAAARERQRCETVRSRVAAIRPAVA